MFNLSNYFEITKDDLCIIGFLLGILLIAYGIALFKGDRFL